MFKLIKKLIKKQGGNDNKLPISMFDRPIKNSEIENFKELEKLVREKQKIEEYLKKTQTIGFFEYFGDKRYIGIIENHNDRFSFKGIEDIIGKEDLYLALEEFIRLLSDKIQKEKDLKEKEISKYIVVVDAK